MVRIQGMTETQSVREHGRRYQSRMVMEDYPNGHPNQSVGKYQSYDDAYGWKR